MRMLILLLFIAYSLTTSGQTASKPIRLYLYNIPNINCGTESSRLAAKACEDPTSPECSCRTDSSTTWSACGTYFNYHCRLQQKSCVGQKNFPQKKMSPGCKSFSFYFNNKILKPKVEESVAMIESGLDLVAKGPSAECAPVDAPVDMKTICQNEVAVGPSSVPKTIFEEYFRYGYCTGEKIVAFRKYLATQGMKPENIQKFDYKTCVQSYQKNLAWNSSLERPSGPAYCGQDPTPVNLQASMLDNLNTETMLMDQPRCIATREILAREALYRANLKSDKEATVMTANSVSITTGGDQTASPFNSNGNGNGLVKTAIGDLDMDWFMDIHYAGGNCGVSHATYTLAKLAWTAIKAGSTTIGMVAGSELKNPLAGNPGPYQDQGEVKALDAICKGTSFKELFPEDYMRRNCPAAYFSDPRSVNVLKVKDWVSTSTPFGEDPYKGIYNP